ncbi:MAG: hypothetical protein LH477_00480 [Nocardioides sp.]|nr:hypothetical protein [Nocardioides sp.]
MSDGESADSLESSRHHVGVLRLLVEASGKFSGVPVASQDARSYRFVGTSGLTAAVVAWLADAQRQPRTDGQDSSRGT